LSELIQVELKIPLFNFEFPALGGSRQQLTEFSAEASREEALNSINTRRAMKNGRAELAALGSLLLLPTRPVAAAKCNVSCRLEPSKCGPMAATVFFSKKIGRFNHFNVDFLRL